MLKFPCNSFPCAPKKTQNRKKKYSISLKNIKYLLYASLGYFIHTHLFFIINYWISYHPFIKN